MKRRGIVAALTLLSIGAALLNINFVFAEDEKAAEIAISPASTKIELVQGELYEGKVTVANIGSTEFDYQIELRPFGVSGDDYTSITFEANEYTSIVNWTTLDKTTGHLAPNENEEIAFTIIVPEKALAGGQYFAIAASTINEPVNQNGFTVNGSVASTIYATILGDAKNSGEIRDNTIPSFYFNGPVEFKSTVSNTGDIHNTATYKIEVRSAFSDDIIYSNEAEPYTHTIMPKTNRPETWTWNAPALGIFRVKQVIEYAGETSVAESTVVICPIWFIVAVVIIILLIVLKIVFAIRKRRDI